MVAKLAPARYRFLALLAAVLLLTGCLYHRMSALEMIGDMRKIHSDSDAYINILWYNGSDDKYDYFGYVYGMFPLGKNYRVPKHQFVLERIPYTEDSTKFVRIRAIEGFWSASRKRSLQDDSTWEPEEIGISIGLQR